MYTSNLRIYSHQPGGEVKYYSQALTLVLISYYNLAHSHLVDIHIPTSEETAMIERVEKEIECDKAEDTLADEDSSFEDQLEAIRVLMENGKLA